MTAVVRVVHTLQRRDATEAGCECGTCRLWACPTCDAQYYIPDAPSVIVAIGGDPNATHLGPWLAGPLPTPPRTGRHDRRPNTAPTSPQHRTDSHDHGDGDLALWTVALAVWGMTALCAPIMLVAGWHTCAALLLAASGYMGWECTRLCRRAAHEGGGQDG